MAHMQHKALQETEATQPTEAQDQPANDGMSAFQVDIPQQEKSKAKHTKRQIFFLAVIVSAVIMLGSVLFLFFHTGGHDEVYDHLVDHISPIVKERFEGFKAQFHKEYANKTEEDKRLVIFDENLKEMFRRSKSFDNFDVYVA